MPTHDVNGRRIALAAAIIALGVALSVLAVFLLLRTWHIPAGTDRVRLPYELVIKGPPLQSGPQLDLAEYRAEKQRILETSAWVDARRGIVRLPIATAMELLAHHAAPAASEPRVVR